MAQSELLAAQKLKLSYQAVRVNLEVNRHLLYPCKAKNDTYKANKLRHNAQRLTGLRKL